MLKITTILPILAALAAHAGTDNALQYIASGYDPATGTWRAYKSDIALQIVHTNGGWSAAQKYGGPNVVFFDQTPGGPASPFQFPPGSTNTLRQIVAVVLCEESAGLASLVSADCPLRFTAYPPDTVFDPPGPLDARELPDGFREFAAAISVNAQDTNIMKPDLSKLQLLEFTFGADTAAGRVFIGGNAANPLWRRDWRGGIAEIVLFPNALSPREANAVRRLMSVKYALRLRTDPDDGIIQVLTNLGMDPSGLFNTTIMVR